MTMLLEDCLEGWVSRSMYGREAWESAVALAKESDLPYIAVILELACRAGCNPLAWMEDLIEADKTGGPA